MSITAMKQALEALYSDDLDQQSWAKTNLMRAIKRAENRNLYTTPQPRKPLTNEQITEIYTKWESTKGTSWADLMRAVEAAHGIKE